jgi:hypothetical protein
MSACPSYETLVALWAGELNDAEAAAVDEHSSGATRVQRRRSASRRSLEPCARSSPS